MRSVRSCLRSVALSVPLLAPVFALPAPLQHRDTAQSDSCVSSRSSDTSCAFLLSTCASIQTLATTTANPWGNFSCVAAAICSSPGAVLDTLACASATLSASSTNSAVARVGNSASMPNLDYAVYASIVGPCAYKSGGCPITSQNVIDYIYSLLKNSKTPAWPSSADHVAKSFWNPVTEWAGFVSDRRVPYTNFNDYLHFHSDLSSSASLASSQAISSLPAASQSSQSTLTTTQTGCAELLESCRLAQIKASSGTDRANPWSKRVCVAAALCAGPVSVLSISNDLERRVQLWPDYGLYATIVGSCAYAKGGCPISNQAFIDFYYGALTVASAKSFPSSTNAALKNIWQPVLSWVNDGDSVSYAKLSDYLRYHQAPSSALTVSTTTIPSTSFLPSSAPTAIPSQTSNPSTSTSSLAQATPVVSDLSIIRIGCDELQKSCQAAVGSVLNQEYWTVKSCVAAAFCAGPDTVLFSNNDLQRQTSLTLSFDMFSLIAGSCAAGPGSCPIDAQKFLDFYYGALSSIGSSSFPASTTATIDSIWKPILTWTAQTDGIPYRNLVDYFKYFHDRYPAPSVTTGSNASIVLAKAPTPGATNAVISTTTNDQAAQWLKAHNDERARHGAPALTWNADASNAAQYWVNLCDFQHALNGELNSWGYSWGQNIGVGTGAFSIADVMKLYIAESADYDFSNPGYSSGTGHWTQIVWKSTTSVGCSSTVCPSTGHFNTNGAPAVLSMCLYKEHGNVVVASGKQTLFINNVLPLST